MKFWMSILIIMAMSLGSLNIVQGAVSDNAGKLLITEVAMKETDDKDWLELYVVDDSVDWHDHRIYRHASSYYPLPDENYSTGQYIVLHEEDGTDDLIANCWHFYNALGTGLRGTDQNIFITDPGTASTYVDAVIYSDANGTYTANKDKANDLVADSMWNTYDFTTGDAGAWTDSDDIGSGQTLARYLHPGAPVYADNNNKGDWYKETNPSQGEINNQTRPDYGDVSGNGQITAYDAQLVLQFVVGLIELSLEQQRAADVSGNGIVTAYDADLILLHIVGLIAEIQQVK